MRVIVATPTNELSVQFNVKTGVIGLGAMGSGMALNLHKAGHLHSIWNRTASKAEKIANSAGVSAADSIEALSSTCELIIVCVSRDEDVLSVVEKIASSAHPGTVVVDTSTVGSDTAKTAAEMLRGKKVSFLDGPVSGGVEGARKGALSMMVGGDEATLNSVRDTLSSFCGTIVHIGPTGSGQACKAVNQILCAGINQTVTEALAFGEDMDLDMTRVLQVVTKGAAGNWFIENRGKTMLAGSFDVGFKVNLHHKDLAICVKMAEKKPGTKIPLVEKTMADYEKLMEQGHGDEDISSLYRLKRHS
jgi:3-hydroxyisobutyrate dehydrogenase